MSAADLASKFTDAERREYWPGPVALQAHRSKAMVKLAWGPVGTAKTSWLCWRAKAIAHRAAKAGYSARMIFIRDTYRNLIDSTFQVWKEWFPPDTAAGYISQSEPIDFKLNVGGRYHDVLFRHGQTEQDASMFLSTEHDGIMLEEVAPAYMPGAKRVSPGIAEGVFDMAYSHLTRKGNRAAAVRPELCLSCNPPPLNHWASTRIIDLSPEKLHALNWAHFYFPIEDNLKNLRPNYYPNLELAWEGKRSLIQRFIKGERLPVFIGIPRFNLDQLDRMRERCQEPSFRGFLHSTEDNLLHVKLEANPQGYVRIWQPPALGRVFIIGADVAGGVEGGNYSSAHVIDDETIEIQAAFHGHIEPEKYAEELAMLGYLYNTALIVVESNNHGLTTLTCLKNLGYPRIYYGRNIEARGRRQERIGFHTDVRTKPMLINGIGDFLAVEKGQPDPYIPDADLIGELQTFGVMENGTCQAQEGCQDDRVISYGLAIEGRKRQSLDSIYPPKKP